MSVDPFTGLTDDEIADLAGHAYEQRTDDTAWQPVPAPEIGNDVRSVVPVSFVPGELAGVEAAARAAGVPMSTYIRQAALSAARTSGALPVAERPGAAAPGAVPRGGADTCSS